MDPDKDGPPSESPASNMPTAPTGSAPPSKTKPRKNLKRFIKPALISLVVLGAAGVGIWYILNNFVGWPYKSLVIDEKKYSVRFDPEGKQVEKEGLAFLQGKELNGQNVINVRFQAVTLPSDCSSFSTSRFKVKVGKTEYPVCSDDGLLEFVYISNFEKDGSWYSATVFSEDEKTKPDEATVKKIISSVKVK